MIDIGIAVKNIQAILQKYVLPESTCNLLPFSDETARAAKSSAIVPTRICIDNRICIPLLPTQCTLKNRVLIKATEL